MIGATQAGDHFRTPRAIHVSVQDPPAAHPRPIGANQKRLCHAISATHAGLYGKSRRHTAMKRPNFKQDALTRVLRENFTPPGSSPELTQPDADHAWHSCYALEPADVAIASVPTPTLDPSHLTKDNRYREAASFLSWLRTMRNSNLVYCSGNYLQHLATEFLAPGPNFCVAGKLSFVIDGALISATQLSKDLLERPWSVATKDSAKQVFHDPSSATFVELDDSGCVNNGEHASPQQSPRIGVPHGWNLGALAASVNCTDEAALDGQTCHCESATLLVSAGTTETGEPCPSELFGKSCQLDAAVQEQDIADGKASSSMSASIMEGPAEHPKTLDRLTGSDHGTTSHKVQDSLAAAVDRVVHNSSVIFQISGSHLAQRLEFVNGLYVPLGWTNVLHPTCQAWLSTADALHGVTDIPMIPEICINK
eukprot:jgi/Ulvmu1/589/UM001_0597.1